jgi:hypothetical protein
MRVLADWRLPVTRLRIGIASVYGEIALSHQVTVALADTTPWPGDLCWPSCARGKAVPLATGRHFRVRAKRWN